MRIKRNTAGSMLRLAWLVGAAGLCWMMAASFALAQPQPSGAQPQTPPPIPPAAQPQAEPQPATPPDINPLPPLPPGTAPTTQPQAKSGGCGGCGGGHGAANTDFTPNDNAKWSCAQQTVTLEGALAGKPLVFAFDIRNEGTEDLKIKAKGG
jgi:hypothetical protein